MNINEEHKRLKDIFKKYPKKQGSRKLESVYDRYDILNRELGFRWKDYKTISILEKVINNDFDNRIYTTGILKYNWGISAVYDLHKKRYFHIDNENGGEIMNKCISGEIGNLNDVIKEIKNKYNVYKNGFVYIMGIKDNVVLPYKKIGKTNNITKRLKDLNSKNPFEVFPLIKWEVELGKETHVEKLLHKKFSHLNKKLEWFTDYDNTLIDKCKEYLNTLSDKIYIKEILVQGVKNFW